MSDTLKRPPAETKIREKTCLIKCHNIGKAASRYEDKTKYISDKKVTIMKTIRRDKDKTKDMLDKISQYRKDHQGETKIREDINRK